MGVQRAPESYQKFWQALQGLETVEVDGHQLLVLPEGAYLLGDPSLGSKMLCRTCYSTLMSVAAEADAEFGIRKVILTGNPGIGKTLGIVEVMRVAASRRVTVVLQLGKEKDERYLFRAGEPVLKGDRESFDEYLEDAGVWYIVDSANSPHACRAWTLYVVSPARELFWRYLKEPTDAGKIYLPVWEKEELDIARSQIYTSTPQPVVDERYARWGGIARYVLERRAGFWEAQDLEEAINKTSWEGFKEALLDLEGGTKFSHRVLHYIVDAKTLKVRLLHTRLKSIC